MVSVFSTIKDNTNKLTCEEIKTNLPTSFSTTMRQFNPKKPVRKTTRDFFR